MTAEPQDVDNGTDLFQHWQDVDEAEVESQDGSHRGGFYFDLVSVHVECGVLVFLILLLIGNAVAMVFLLAAYSHQDVYVIPGTKRTGTTAILWGRELGDDTRERIMEMERRRQLKLEEQRPDLELDTEELLQDQEPVPAAEGDMAGEGMGEEAEEVVEP